MTLSPTLSRLVAELDSLGSNLSLASIAGLLTSAKLTPRDVQEFIHPNPRHYHRAHVVRRANYELLVMTWLPGQASPPHDHTGSVCALQVVQGEAIEADYSIAPDGCVHWEYESTIGPGRVSAGQDAGIHTIRNPSASETLVTVHVYAPPLADFRRFIARTEPHADAAPPPDTVAIIGGGFSGAMTAANLLKHDAARRVVLIERRGTVGEGLAYGTRDDAHLLNVPAARMSAWPDQPNHFLDWARQQNPDVRPGDFLPRMQYGDYVRETLQKTGTDHPDRLDIRLDEVRRVMRHPAGGWMVHLSRGSSLRARAVILAIGHRPPNDPLAGIWDGPRERFLADPWRPYALNVIEPHERVGILGSGLTAVDTVLSLTEEPRTGPITFLSRSGLLPHSHSRTPVAPWDAAPLVQSILAQPASIRQLSRAVHREARRMLQTGGDWRSVIDGLRPHTATLWQHLPNREKQRFISRIRPFWEIHRHRMAPHIADRIVELIGQETLRRLTAVIRRATGSRDQVTVEIQERGCPATRSMTFDWIINCTGPAPSNFAESNPVIGSLLIHGWISRDELSLGLRTDAVGRAIGPNGQTLPDLLIVGTLRKPLLWESTAVPELRGQAEAAAKACIRTSG
jgi:uncharacterized NAD(P)/FAD-binding protein YdhS/predicted metal-dependent enzyme (double-stranded beta helix superfamily)